MIWYVNSDAFRDGDGSQCRPFRHINDAAQLAHPGDEIVVAPGIYREHVIPRYAGTEDARITYRSEIPGKAVITGAEAVTNWENVRGNLWTARIPNSLFGDYNPYTTFVCGDWYFAPTVRHTGSVYLNDRTLFETVTLEECEKGKVSPTAWIPEDSIYKWYTKQDGNETVLYANFQGFDPNHERVEINVRRNCFMPTENGINYITVSGFKLCRAATTWAPPAAYQDGLIGPHWAKGWIIEDCEVFDSKCCGISLGKYRDPDNDMYFYTRHVKSPTQMERDAVCRGQYHGWLKENIGHHIIRRCHIHHCQQTGIVGRMGGVFSTIEDCHIHDICNTQQLGGAETAGIKLHAAIDVTIRRNHIHHCIIGVWCDWQAQGTRISQNLMHDNMRPKGVEHAQGSMFSSDVFIEVSHGPTLIDNNVLLSKQSITIPSEGLAIIHNLVAGGFGLINSGVDSIVNGQREPRYTPYHIHHRTEVAGFMTILHGDDRIYNNIFVQHHPINAPERTAQSCDYEVVGTAPFDIFPDYDTWYAPFKPSDEPNMGGLGTYHFGHLPVWVSGNAYLNGATVSKHESNGCIPEVTAKLKLDYKDAKIVLSSDIYEAIKDFKIGVITTESLGEAFEPEQRFENPDGTPIVFDRDFFGAHRSVESAPGPFAIGKEAVVLFEHEPGCETLYQSVEA